MKTTCVLVSCLAFIGAVSAAVTGQKDRFKLAFNTPPEFSHGRDVVAPQNVGIIETVTPPYPETQFANSNPNQGFAIGPQPSNQNTNAVGAGIPIKLPAMTSMGGVNPTKLGQESNKIQQNSIKSQFRKQNPIVTKAPVRHVFPRQTMQNKPMNQLTNDRLVNQMMRNSASSVTTPRTTNRRRGCNFNIPSFLLPDMSVTQKEFEQRYLLPALRAHLTMKACRSRALTVYIDWLLYLRLRNFNV